MNDLSENYQHMKQTQVSNATLKQYKDDIVKEVEEKIIGQDKLKDSKLGQVDDLMERINLLESKHKEQSVVIAN